MASGLYSYPCRDVHILEVERGSGPPLIIFQECKSEKLRGKWRGIPCHPSSIVHVPRLRGRVNVAHQRAAAPRGCWTVPTFDPAHAVFTAGILDKGSEEDSDGSWGTDGHG